MRKYLLPKNGNFYKANLHSHSTYSDGKLTPEEMKKAYVEKGYSILAFTDHNILVSHNDLTDDKFLALNGLEIDFYEGWNPDFVSDGKSYLTWKGTHLNFIALSPDNIIQPCFHRTKNRIIGSKDKYAHLIKYDENKPDFEKIYSGEGVTAAMQEARDNGFYVIYNHPCWSLESIEDIKNYHGFHAMEICNYGSFVEGTCEYAPKIYDDVLRLGKRVFCVAADDNHNRHPFDSRHNDSFGGFTMIKAEKLSYENVANALLNGDFYASMGPEINELYYEDGKVFIKTSKADKISLSCGTRRSKSVFDEDGNGLYGAEFTLTDEDVYFRITVTDKENNNAHTRAYFLDELIEK